MDLWLDVFVRFRYGWVYPILGTGLGVGMALVINALRASSHWKDFLERQDGHLTGFRETAEVTRKIMKLALPYAWFLPLAIGLAAVFAFLTPDTVPVTNAAAPIKASREDLILGIAADGLTQAIGAYFGICGMGLGMVVMRRGLHVQSRNDLT